jgi:hypothetical protein
VQIVDEQDGGAVACRLRENLIFCFCQINCPNKASPKASPAGYCRCEEEGTMIMSKCTVYVYLKMIIER